jgi:hypothetical protein
MYGTNSSFQADILRTEYKGQDKHKDIKFEIVIVDEVDNMFIDDFSKSTYLAESKQGMDKLLFIFLQMWEEFLKIEGNFINKKQAEIRSDTNKEYKFYAERFEMTNQLVKVTLRNLEENKKLSFLNIPDYLKVYIQTNLETWAMNLIKAKYDMEENKDYSTKGGRVCPVDYTNTGVTQRNSQYGEGLQQFLQIKHNLELTEHHLITNFFSNIGQFTRYMDCDGENCIFALTGTLGENHKSKEILQDIYKVDLVDIPTNKPRQFEEPQILICNNTHQQKVKLIDTLQEYKSRTVLVIFETIKQVDEFKKELQGKDLSKQIYPYTDSEDSASNNFISTNIFQSGDIILSTNLSGRGCDIKISQDVETRGGLHVILTFVPESSRAEKQAFGRAARKGQKGSGEFILNLEYENLKIPQTMLYTNFIVNERERNSTREEILKKMGPKLPQEILEIILNPTIKLFELRNLREDKKIDETKKEIESIKIKDGLFMKFCKMLTVDLLGIQKRDPINFHAIEERWGMWLLEQPEDLNEAEFNKKFEDFKKSILDDYKNQQVMKNPNMINYICKEYLYNFYTGRGGLWRKIWYKMSNKGINIEDVKSKLNDSIKMNPCCFIPYYLKAFCILEQGKEKAYDEFRSLMEQSRELIKNEILFLKFFSKMLREKGMNEKNINNWNTICEILIAVDWNIGNNLEDLEEIEKSKKKPLIKIDTFRGAPFEEKEEYLHMCKSGLQCFSIKKKTSNLWKVSSTFLLGAICIGVGLSLGPFWGFLVGNLGQCSIFYGIDSLINGEFSYKELLGKLALNTICSTSLYYLASLVVPIKSFMTWTWTGVPLTDVVHFAYRIPFYLGVRIMEELCSRLTDKFAKRFHERKNAAEKKEALRKYIEAGINDMDNRVAEIIQKNLEELKKIEEISERLQNSLHENFENNLMFKFRKIVENISLMQVFFPQEEEHLHNGEELLLIIENLKIFQIENIYEILENLKDSQVNIHSIITANQKHLEKQLVDNKSYQEIYNKYKDVSHTSKSIANSIFLSSENVEEDKNQIETIAKLVEGKFFSSQFEIEMTDLKLQNSEVIEKIKNEDQESEEENNEEVVDTFMNQSDREVLSKMSELEVEGSPMSRKSKIEDVFSDFKAKTELKNKNLNRRVQETIMVKAKETIMPIIAATAEESNKRLEQTEEIMKNNCYNEQKNLNYSLLKSELEIILHSSSIEVIHSSKLKDDFKLDIIKFSEKNLSSFYILEIPPSEFSNFSYYVPIAVLTGVLDNNILFVLVIDSCNLLDQYMREQIEKIFIGRECSIMYNSGKQTIRWDKSGIYSYYNIKKLHEELNNNVDKFKYVEEFSKQIFFMSENKELDTRRYAAEEFLKNKLLLEKKKLDEQYLAHDNTSTDCYDYLSVFVKVLKELYLRFDQLDDFYEIILKYPELEIFKNLIEDKKFLEDLQSIIVNIDERDFILKNFDIVAERKAMRKKAKKNINKSVEFLKECYEITMMEILIIRAHVEEGNDALVIDENFY